MTPAGPRAKFVPVDPLLTPTALGHLAAIISSSDDAIISKTLDGIITSWNHGAERIYGYTAVEMVGRPLAILIPPGRANEEPAILQRIREGGVIDHYETVRVAKDGRMIDVSVTISPIRDGEGHIIGASKIARDITERKRAEARLRHLNEDLERRVLERTAELQATTDELEAFSYSISHDLRAPLRSIQSFTELLQQDCLAELGEVGRGYVDRIIQAAQRMDQLTRDILSFAQSGRVALSSAPVDMNALVAATVKELEPETKGRRIAWRIADLPAVRGDAGLLRQVWANLLSNALKYTRKRESAAITVTGAATPEGLLFTVADNGVGFDMAYVGKLFEIFERLHPDQFEGTGVGLAHVRRIVERHGGRIWAEGKPGAGATFSFLLPTQGPAA